MKTVACPKCDGQKTIAAFSHYASGVCFCCAGSGVMEISDSQSAQIEADAVDTAAKRQWLLTASYEKIASLPWKKLHAAFGFAATCAACGDKEIDRILPNVRKAFEAAL
jgi:hypothetical protein